MTGVPSGADAPSTVVDTDFTSTRSRVLADAQAGSGLARSKPDGPESLPQASASVKAAVPDASASGQVPKVVAATRVPVQAFRPAAPAVVTAVPPAAAMSPLQAAAANLVPAAALRPRPAATATALVADRPIATAIRQLVDSAANGLGALPAGPFTDFLQGGLLLVRRTLFPNDPGGQVETTAALTSPTITVHNNGPQTIYVYNLTNSGEYNIPATPWPAPNGQGPTPPTPIPPDWKGPVSIAPGSSAPVTLALFNGTGSPGKASSANRIYIVEDPGFNLPIGSSPYAMSGVDAFNPFSGPTPPTNPGCSAKPQTSAACDSFKNYSFVEYNLYPAPSKVGGNWYTIDTSYIDEWSLPIQTKFTLNGANWNGAVNGRKYGFTDFDTAVNQLNAAGKTGTPYPDLVWSGITPYGPQPPATLKRIVGPDKVWAQQFNEPTGNVNMNETGWVPSSYQNFVESGSYVSKVTKKIVYPYAQNGTQYAPGGNFNFWKNSVTGPVSTPYPIALRTAAILDGFPADSSGVYGFFTFPNDEAAGQFTNIPAAVSLDIYVYGSSDGASDSLIPGGRWFYSAPSSPEQWLIGPWRQPLTGTSATDTFIMNYLFKTKTATPPTKIVGAEGDILVIDKGPLAGAKSNVVDVVDKAKFGPKANFTSQFVYETSTGYLYYDRNPSSLLGYTGVLAYLSPSTFDPAKTLFVL